MAAPLQPQLWQQLQFCAQALAAVNTGKSATAALQQVEARHRPGVQALLFDVLRLLGLARALRDALASRKPSTLADALLCAALALLAQGERYDAHTLVHQAVEAARRHPALKHQAAFLNACLRRFLRERDALTHQARQHDPAARWNCPPWWIERLQHDWPGHWQDILHADATHAPMTLRVNLARTTQAHFLHLLKSAGMSGWPQGEAAITLSRPCPVDDLPGFRQGLVSVQDAAAQLAAPLLLAGLEAIPAQALRVLDACAAPGGKTAHLLEYAAATALPIEVTALDVDAQRSQRIRQNLQRLNLQAQVLVADAAQPQDWWAQACGAQPFDAILLDAPCSASGIVRRHPDVRWLRRAGDIAQLAAVQAHLLQALWPLLRPGGRLLYSTCSVFRAEGEAQIQAFAQRCAGVQRLPSPGHMRVQTASCATADAAAHGTMADHDGFYYALLRKKLD